jgi:hypothetical protein
MPLETGRAVDKYLEKLYQRPEILVRKIKKSNYTQLIEDYSRQVCKWTDPEFPPNDSSVGVIQGVERVYWKRVSEIVDNPSFIGARVDPSDLLVNETNGGYFASCLAVISEQGHRIKNLFPALSINAYGIYMARLMLSGTYREVVVDDFVPCD